MRKIAPKQETLAADSGKINDRWQLIFQKYMVLFVLIGLVVIASLLTDSFFTPQNISNILRQVTSNGIIALGMTYAIMTGGIDISVGSIVGFASLIFISCFNSEGLIEPFNSIFGSLNAIMPGGYVAPILIAASITLALCLVIGLINGIGIAKLKLPEFIMTMSMVTVLKGITLVICDGRSIYLDRSYKETIGWLGSGRVAGIPVPVIVFVILAIVMTAVLDKTTYGRYVRAIGGNYEAARLAGIKAVFYRGSVYLITAGMAAIAGILISCRTLSGEPLLGDGYELDAIAATVIGGTAMCGGVGHILGTVLGALIIGVLNNLLNLMNISAYFQYVVKGLIIFVAVLMRTERKKE